jgi:hypothetical protein
VQPIETTTITRAWHWGIAIVSDADSGGLIPDVDPEAAVSANAHGLVILVRHAQDIESFEGDFVFAEASLTVRLLHEPAPIDHTRRIIFDGRLQTPSGSLLIGDADGDARVSAHEKTTALVVSVPMDDVPGSPSSVQLDLSPA